jgi:hypothetical protein
MRKLIILLSTAAIVFGAVSIGYAQAGLSGNWEWRSPMDKDKRQTIFGINVIVKKGKVSGTYFFNDLQNGETESDGAVAGFIGTVKGNVMTVEFDPQAGDPGYTENVRYRRPKGRLPSLATVTLKNGKLEWVQTRGELGQDMPKTLTLKRSK